MTDPKAQSKADSYPAQITVILRLIAAGYLLYLGASLLPEIGASSGSRQYLQIGCMAVFVLVGVILGAWSLIKIIKKEIA